MPRRALKQAGIAVTTDVVGFDVAKPQEAARLRAIAKAGGGVYTDARTARALSTYFEQAIDAYSEAAKSKVCVLSDRAKQAHCMNLAHSDALGYMNRASLGQTGARAKEISLLASKFDKENSARRSAFQNATDATADRLEREVQVARRRYEKLVP